MRAEDNPFNPPAAPGSTRTRRLGSPAWAVFAGVLADIGGSLVVGFLMAVIAAAMLVAEGMPSEQVETALTNPDPTSWFSIVGYAVGCAFSFLGGYLCARVAGYAEYKLGAVVAAIVTGFTLLLGWGQMSIPLSVFLTLLTVASIMSGAWRGAARNRASG